MRCPFCGGPIEERPEYISMSFRRQSIYKFIVDAGPGGVDRDVVMERFFPGKKQTTLRTTICGINKTIKPIRIVSVDTVLRIATK